MMTATALRADLVAYDAEDRPVLLVEVKGEAVASAARDQLGAYLGAARPSIPFAMLATRERITVFEGGSELGRPLLSMATADILSHYDPDFSAKPIYAFYLGILVEGWLRDLAYHWRSPNPPAEAEMASVGLLDRLRGGTTRSEVPLHGDPLH